MHTVSTSRAPINAKTAIKRPLIPILCSLFNAIINFELITKFPDVAWKTSSVSFFCLVFFSSDQGNRKSWTILYLFHLYSLIFYGFLCYLFTICILQIPNPTLGAIFKVFFSILIVLTWFWLVYCGKSCFILFWDNWPHVGRQLIFLHTFLFLSFFDKIWKQKKNWPVKWDFKCLNRPRIRLWRCFLQ